MQAKSKAGLIRAAVRDLRPCIGRMLAALLAFGSKGRSEAEKRRMPPATESRGGILADYAWTSSTRARNTASCGLSRR